MQICQRVVNCQWKPYYILDLADTTATDFNNPKAPHTVLRFRLPFPGVYKFNSHITDLNGCENYKYYYVINAHFAQFGSPDSVSCVSKPVHFTDKVRYFTTDYNLLPPSDAFFSSPGVPNPFMRPGAHDESGIWDSVFSTAISGTSNGGLLIL